LQCPIESIWNNETIQTDSNDIIPAMVADYRKFKGKADMRDSNHLRYLFQYKHRKWTQAVVTSLLNIFAATAWSLYKEHSMRDVLQPQDFELMSNHFKIRIVIVLLGHSTACLNISKA